MDTNTWVWGIVGSIMKTWESAMVWGFWRIPNPTRFSETHHIHKIRLCRIQIVCCIYLCMYVCMSEDLYPACLKQSNRCAVVSNKNDFNVCLKRSVDRSTEHKEIRRLFQILDPTAKLRSRNVLLVRGTTRRTSQYPTIEVCAGWS